MKYTHPNACLVKANNTQYTHPQHAAPSWHISSHFGEMGGKTHNLKSHHDSEQFILGNYMASHTATSDAEFASCLNRLPRPCLSFSHQLWIHHRSVSRKEKAMHSPHTHFFVCFPFYWITHFNTSQISAQKGEEKESVLLNIRDVTLK